MPPYNMEHSQSFSDGGLPSSSSSSLDQSLPVKRRSPLHHELHKSTSNIETRDELLHLAALELEAMRSSPPTSTSTTNSQTNTNCHTQNQRTLPPQCSNNKNNTNNFFEPPKETERSFPPACLHLLQSLPQNTKCHDCQSSSSPATWASVSYGITLCLQCSGKHRSLGVQCSFIKSLTLDSWKRREILCLLEGGNEQLSGFFERHEMGGGGGSPMARRTITTVDEPKGTIMAECCNTASSSTSGGSIGSNTMGVLDRYKTKAASFYRQHLQSHARSIEGREGLYQGREASRTSSSSSRGGSGGKKKSSAGKSKSSSSGSGSHRKKDKKSGGRSNKGGGCGSKQARKLPTVTEKED